MGRRNKYEFVESLPPYPCYFGCGRELRTKYDASAIFGWEWFTGYGAGPIHFCPACRRSRQFEIDRFREQLNIRPEGYPQVKATLNPPSETERQP